MSICAFIPVFNEEERIEATLISLQWCDEIIMVDKNSTDRTCEIASKYGAKIFSMPNSNQYDPREFEYLMKSSSDWIIIFTASDVIHPMLAQRILSIINDPNFEYDILDVPFKNYVLGIASPRSPWHREYYSYIFRKSIVNLNFEGVHGLLDLSKGRHYKVPVFGDYYMYHLTHATVDGMMDRHLRYWRTEGANYKDVGYAKAFKKLKQSVYHVIFKSKTFLMGWDGVALICAYMSYAMMSFVYKWENRKGDAANEKYLKIKDDIKEAWLKQQINVRSSKK